MPALLRDGYGRDLAVWFLLTIVLGAAAAWSAGWLAERSLSAAVDRLVGESGRYDALIQVRADAREAAREAAEGELRRLFGEQGAELAEGPSIGGYSHLFLSLPQVRPAAEGRRDLESLRAGLQAIPGFVSLTFLLEPSLLIEGAHPALARRLLDDSDGAPGVRTAFQNGSNLVFLLESSSDSEKAAAWLQEELDRWRRMAVLAEGEPGRPGAAEVLRESFGDEMIPEGVEAPEMVEQEGAQALRTLLEALRTRVALVGEGAGRAGRVALVPERSGLRPGDALPAGALIARLEPKGAHRAEGYVAAHVEGTGDAPMPNLSSAAGGGRRWLAFTYRDGRLEEHAGVAELEPGLPDLLRALGAELAAFSGQALQGPDPAHGQERSGPDPAAAKESESREKSNLEPIAEPIAELKEPFADADSSTDGLGLAALPAALARLESVRAEVAELRRLLQERAEEADAGDVLLGLALHALLRALVPDYGVEAELDEAEAALIEDMDGLGLGWLQDASARLAALEETLRRLDGDGLSRLLRLVESEGEQASLLVRADLPREEAERLLREAGFRDVRLYAAPAGAVRTSPRAALDETLAQARRVVAVIVGLIAGLFSLLLDQATLFVAWEWASGGRGPARRRLGMLTGFVMMPAIVSLGGAGPLADVLVWAGPIGMLAGLWVASAAERISPLSREEWEAGVALGLTYRQVMREIVVPAARPGLLAALNRHAQQFR